MTSSQQDQQDQGLTPAEEATVLALALFLASRLAVSATRLPAYLVARLVTLGLSQRAVQTAGRVALAPPLTGRGRYGSPAQITGRTTLPAHLPAAAASRTRVRTTVTATNVVVSSTARDVKADEPTMRATYLFNAAKRLTEAEQLGVFEQAARREQRYMDQQRAAGKNRARAASALDRTAAEAGPNGKLRWNAVMDERTTADCRALNGVLFTLDSPPSGLIPGAVHPRCRCFATVAYDSNASAPTVTVSD